MISFEVNQPAGKKIAGKLWRKWLENIEKTLKIKRKIEISVAVVGGREIKRLNKIYRGKNQVTDVLSFGGAGSLAKFSAGNYLGEIVICYPQSARQAKKIGHSINKEIELLLVHGFLHLLGHDHEKPAEAKRMRELERTILEN